MSDADVAPPSDLRPDLPSGSPPDLPDALAAALDRLAGALGRLRQASQAKADRAVDGPPDDGSAVAALQAERDRLSSELAEAAHRAERLREAQTAVLERIGRAEASIVAAMRDVGDGVADEDGVEDAP